MAGQTEDRARIEALRQKARLVIAVEHELRDLRALPTREYASAKALIDAVEARGQAKLRLAAEQAAATDRHEHALDQVRKAHELA